MDAPKRPWWRKKRWLAAGLLLVALSYPLSFVPAMWVATRLSVRPERQAELSFLGWLYRPIAIALIESPHPLRNGVYWIIELGAPDNIEFAKGYDRGVMWSGPSFTYTLLWY